MTEKPKFNSVGVALLALKQSIRRRTRKELEATVFEMLKPEWLRNHAPELEQDIEQTAAEKPGLIEVVKA